MQFCSRYVASNISFAKLSFVYKELINQCLCTSNLSVTTSPGPGNSGNCLSSISRVTTLLCGDNCGSAAFLNIRQMPPTTRGAFPAKAFSNVYYVYNASLCLLNGHPPSLKWPPVERFTTLMKSKNCRRTARSTIRKISNSDIDLYHNNYDLIGVRAEYDKYQKYV